MEDVHQQPQKRVALADGCLEMEDEVDETTTSQPKMMFPSQSQQQQVQKDPKLVNLIAHVRDCPGLWSGEVDEATDTEKKRNELWNAIAKLCGFESGNAAKNHWETLYMEFTRSRGRPGRPTAPRRIYADDMEWFLNWQLEQNSQKQLIVAVDSYRHLPNSMDVTLDETEENGQSESMAAEQQMWNGTVNIDPNLPTILVNNKGGERLTFQGHDYMKHRGDPLIRSVWRCVNYPKVGCKGRMVYGRGGIDAFVTQEHSDKCIPFSQIVRRRKMEYTASKYPIPIPVNTRKRMKIEGSTSKGLQEGERNESIIPENTYFQVNGESYNDFGPYQDDMQGDGEGYARGETSDNVVDASGYNGYCEIFDDDGETPPGEHQKNQASATGEIFTQIQLALEQERLREARIRNQFLSRRLRLEENKLRLENEVLQLDVQKRSLELEKLKSSQY